jgi:hypothetical protein
MRAHTYTLHRFGVPNNVSFEAFELRMSCALLGVRPLTTTRPLCKFHKTFVNDDYGQWVNTVLVLSFTLQANI